VSRAILQYFGFRVHSTNPVAQRDFGRRGVASAPWSGTAV